MKKKTMEQVIRFYAYPENFDDTEKLRIARIINSNWNWGIICERCFKRTKSIVNSRIGKWICRECEDDLK